MTPRTYFRGSLVIPVAGPVLLFFAAPDTAAATLALLSLTFGGVAYLAFAGTLWYLLGTHTVSTQHVRLAVVSPILFVPVQAASWLIYSALFSQSRLTVEGTLYPLLPFAAYTLVVGYLYVAIVYTLYRSLTRLGAISP